MINYYTTTDIYLSIEDYTNKGLKQDDIIEMISHNFSCIYPKKSGINHNIIISTKSKDEEVIRELVFWIEEKLNEMLEGKISYIAN